MAVKLVIEPLFEADFQAYSFGFRPQKSAQEASQMIRYVVKGGAKLVLDVDLKSYVDTIPHDKLMVLVEERVTNVWVLRLIRWWLKAGVLEDGQVTSPTLGTPQGGVVSPLLANLFLHYAFDEWMRRRDCSTAISWQGVLPRRGETDEELPANVLGKPCVGKLQARFDEKALETYGEIRGAPVTYSMIG